MAWRKLYINFLLCSRLRKIWNVLLLGIFDFSFVLLLLMTAYSKLSTLQNCFLCLIFFFVWEWRCENPEGLTMKWVTAFFFSCACTWILEFVAFTVVNVISHWEVVVEERGVTQRNGIQKKKNEGRAAPASLMEGEEGNSLQHHASKVPWINYQI